ncbi:hypothetical protein PZA11_007711 [Diplocarpon coronariae]|uniref:Uncharacterized protein n=1 Tax=Diplocarpon coronariae TaxID=2795749 RepID=A0A218YUG6_9HELO|nr:hypothetical protein B2J93_9426 [Marssonina coronariae]
MQLQALLFSLLLATSVVAHGDKEGKDTSEKSQCRQIRKLEKLVSLAANSTRLEQVTDNNATKIAELKSEASTAAQRLTNLQSNATLAASCAVVNAQAEEEHMCEETFGLERFVRFAANATQVAAVTGSNANETAAIAARALQASARLQALQSNATLQAACPAFLQQHECREMRKLQRFVEASNNAKKLEKISGGDAIKAGRLRDEAARAQTQLTEWQANKTFVAACEALGNSGKGIDSGATTEEDATNGQIGAASSGAGIRWTMLSTILVVGAAMSLL